jgi:hypothetical protein
MAVAKSRTSLRIGGASGYWGDADDAIPQLLKDPQLDFLVFDYLAEITMSILARAHAQDPRLGYATDFISDAMTPHLAAIAKRGIRVISNAGGINPMGCAEALQAVLREQGLSLRIAVITGDDLRPMLSDIASAGVVDMFSGEAFPSIDQIASVNAYIGAEAIAEALNSGADIVITGRCVDSAVTLGACLHHFGWALNDYDRLAGGALAGHIIECGAQATGGNFTDWSDVVDSLAEVGYPIAEITEDGTFTVTKPPHTGGLVSIATIGEQMLYEIGDPAAYLLPDVTCDFRYVTLAQRGADCVEVSNARGYAPSPFYKVCATFQDGWRGGSVFFYYGSRADERARAFAQLALARANAKLEARGMAPYTETLVEVIGDESHYGAYRRVGGSREVAVKIAAKHPDRRGAGLLIKEMVGVALSAPPGLTMFAGGRAKPSPVVRLLSFLWPKDRVELLLHNLDGRPGVALGQGAIASAISGHAAQELPQEAPQEAPQDTTQRTARGAKQGAKEGTKQGTEPNALQEAEGGYTLGLPPASRGFDPRVLADAPRPGEEPPAPAERVTPDRLIEVPLEQLAWVRSGDKGDKANIGVLPRHPALSYWLWQTLTEQLVAERFAHFLKGSVTRFYLPGTGSINIVLDQVLGGGGMASLRNDPQGKGYSQLLLQIPIAIPADLVTDCLESVPCP